MSTKPTTEPSTTSAISTTSTSATELIDLARSYLDRNQTQEANDVLMEIVTTYSSGAISSIPGLLSTFRELFEKRIELLMMGDNDDNDGHPRIDFNAVAIERIGLASLLCDQGQYADAVRQLKQVVVVVTHDNDDTTSPTQQQQIQYDHTAATINVGLQEKAAAMLFRTKTAICDWDDYDVASEALVRSVDAAIASHQIPAVHPFESLMFPCLSLQTCTEIAKRYAQRAVDSIQANDVSSSTSLESAADHTTTTTMVDERSQSSERISNASASQNRRKIKIGYISPDFTGRHPLAFLLQDMFRFHDKHQFDIYVYSVFEEPDGSSEVSKIVESADHWTVLHPSMTSSDMAQTIRHDNIDILVDLCGYTGTSIVAEIMAHRAATSLQIAYMGFPASSGATFIDYMICDQTVIPPEYRHHYTESLIVMPHSYFVNSHMFLPSTLRNNNNSVEGNDVHSLSSTAQRRKKYGLPPNGFVFCCHSRPDKIDPVSFMSWIRALKTVRAEGVRTNNRRQSEACLWLLRSDPEMETNVLQKVLTVETNRNVNKNSTNSIHNDDENVDLSSDWIVFADKVPREEHLQRLQLADLFLDTPAYGAHTVGCDCLSAGVPLLTLLRPSRKDDDDITDVVRDEKESVSTEKLPSRVGASLVKALGDHTGLDKDLIVPSMEEYEATMIRATRGCDDDGNNNDNQWFASVRQRVEDAVASCTMEGSSSVGASAATTVASPLFDTQRWVRNMEKGLVEAWTNSEQQRQQSPWDNKVLPDVYVSDNGE